MTEAERIAATEAALLAAVRERGGWLSGDRRIGESLLADLLGLRCESLANMRSEGKAPVHVRLGGGGHRITYRLADVAEWLESKRGE